MFAQPRHGLLRRPLDGYDTGPVANFYLPPAAATAKGTLTGSVIDFDTHAPVPERRVAFPVSTRASPATPARPRPPPAVPVPAPPFGPYPYLVAVGAGYELRS